MSDASSQPTIVFDCGTLSQRIDEPKLLHPQAPTNDHSAFVEYFRTAAKHPTRISLNIPQLPTVSEVASNFLPNFDANFSAYEEEPDIRGRGRGRVSLRERGRIWGGRREKGKQLLLRLSSKEDKLSRFILVSMTCGEDSIVFLYNRFNVYLMAIRDVKRKWWEFSECGGVLFSDARPLGFTESYQAMATGSAVSVGYFQFDFAFRVFCHPDRHSIDDRKKASQIMIALTSESGRLVLLANKFGATLSDINGSSTVVLEGLTRTLMRNWEKGSHNIIDNSGPNEMNKDIEEVFPKDYDLVKALKEGGMNKIKDAHLAYGLLLAKPDISSLDEGKKNKSQTAGTADKGKKIKATTCSSDQGNK